MYEIALHERFFVFLLPTHQPQTPQIQYHLIKIKAKKMQNWKTQAHQPKTAVKVSKFLKIKRHTTAIPEVNKIDKTGVLNLVCKKPNGRQSKIPSAFRWIEAILAESSWLDSSIEVFEVVVECTKRERS